MSMIHSLNMTEICRRAFAPDKIAIIFAYVQCEWNQTLEFGDWCFITARIRRMGKLMFLQVSVC